jgi:hypothetical protein
MAWSNRARLSGKLVKSMNRKWYALRPENPYGIPKAVMKALAQEHLPPQRRVYTKRLQALMQTIEANGRK